MEKILSFFVSALKWLSKPLSQINEPSEEIKYVITEDVLKRTDVAASLWVSLAKQFKDITKTKKSKPLLEIHERVLAAMGNCEELNGFDMKNNNPFEFLIRAKAMTRQQLIVQYSNDVVCIEAGLLEKMFKTIIAYNFFKKYKDKAGSHFEKAEADMRGLVESNKLPGRFSWNNFVPHEEKKKDKPDFSFFDQYGLAITEVSQPYAIENAEAVEQSTERSDTIPDDYFR